MKEQDHNDLRYHNYWVVACLDILGQTETMKDIDYVPTQMSEAPIPVSLQAYCRSNRNGLGCIFDEEFSHRVAEGMIAYLIPTPLDNLSKAF